MSFEITSKPPASNRIYLGVNLDRTKPEDAWIFKEIGKLLKKTGRSRSDIIKQMVVHCLKDEMKKPVVMGSKFPPRPMDNRSGPGF